MTRDTHTYCRAFSIGAVITCLYDLGLSRLGFEHLTYRLQDQRSNPLRHRRGNKWNKYNHNIVKRNLYWYDYNRTEVFFMFILRVPLNCPAFKEMFELIFLWNRKLAIFQDTSLRWRRKLYKFWKGNIVTS